uniref:Protein 4.1 n=1 Tax=Myripristis murdjan TaxID=586833 RepID=A0A667YFZ9_9TELE
MTTEASAVSEADTEGKQKASGAEPEPQNKPKSGAAASESEKEKLGKKAQEQASEPGPADGATSPEEEQLKPRTRTSAGKGLSRLFSSFLKRRSQCSEGEGFEAEKAKEEKADKEEKVTKAEQEKVEEVKTEEKEAEAEEEKSEEKELKKSEEEQVEQKEEKKEERVEKKGSKKKRKENKRKAEERDEERLKKKEEEKEEEKTKKKEEEKKEEKAQQTVEKEEKEEKLETKGDKEEATDVKEDKKADVGRKESKEEEKVDKKVAKKKEKEEKAKRKEEEKAKRKAEEDERVKKREEEKAKKEEEKAKKKEEEKLKDTKKKEEEKVKEEAKKKEEGKRKEEKVEQKEEKGKEEEGKKKEKGKNKGKKEVKEQQVKAPIAAPEPELKTELEIEQAPDQHSVSSAETQPAQEEHKQQSKIKRESVAEEGQKEDTQKKEGEKDQKEEEVKKEEKKTEEATKEKPKKEKKTEKKAEEAKGSKKQKTMQCTVTLLDDAQFECELDKHAKGQELFMQVCDHLNLLEKDYFGLANWETPTSKTWLDPSKEIRKQVPGAVYEFTFNVKFYPPDPAQLTEDLTRYYLCLQLRKDIIRGTLPCSFVTLSLLGSYTAQSELGEYDPEIHGTDYVKELNLATGQTQELEEKVMELHRTYRSMSPAQADMLFLENAKKLAMYGVDLHQAKDLEGVDIMLGVCSSGLMVYKDKLRINRFPWPKVLKISYKRSSFFIKIRPSEQEQYESTIGFKLPNYKASKKLWKVCVEHHTFFRVSTVEPPSSRRFLALGSKFRYSGRTQAQTRQASAEIVRPAPRFTRSASKRLSRNLDGVVGMQKGTRPVSAPVFSQAALAEAGIPVALDQPQTSTPIKTSRKEERKLEVTVETVEPPKTETAAEVKEFDKPQEDLLRHHASISELKRNFMESVPEARPSEWDKRLSTHSPFRTLGINGQPLPSADGRLGISAVRDGSDTEAAHEETSSSLGFSDIPSPAVSRKSEPDSVEAHDGPDVGESCDQEESIVSETSLVPIVEVEMAKMPPSHHPCSLAVDETQLKEEQEEEASYPGLEYSGTIVGSSPASYFMSGGPHVIRCFQATVDEADGTKDGATLSSTRTSTSESTSGTTVTTTTTHISKVVKGGSSETRVEKRIVITADSEADQDQGNGGGASAK